MYKNDNPTPIEKEIIKRLKYIYDPEMPVNIFDLGLIYNIEVNDNNDVKITMTLTSPNCPVGELLPQQVVSELQFMRELNKIEVDVTFEPPWDSDLISDEAKLDLGLL
ncbi:MAG: metal-sulfur cluster assembly factor [Bacteroidales bacterium]|jgi:FeS assembly SUF system protein|nr:DUF59 domain-containing protein [Bacteroidales bacterium]